MQYSISYKNPLSHLVDIEITIQATDSDFIVLQLPAWRPGRYELQNYAANIKQFQAVDEKGNRIPFTKITRNQWEIENKNSGAIKVRYQYYAYQMDAGGCWLDEEQLYLNFICCLMYQPALIDEACSVRLSLPETYTIACGLSKEGHVLTAENFYHLVDSPMIASASLIHFSFLCQNIPFHLWIQGKNFVSEEKIKNNFLKYTEHQIKMMGDFPEKEYHYLFQFLPYRHYHGVEHRNSTVITLGPSEAIPEKGYSDLIGISSHELFHAWNIIKIRPAEMSPYDFTKENYFETGFVAEGFTTYYGDLFLVRSGVISVEEYFEELNTTLKRHFDHFGNYNLSLAESSKDLWVDGYAPGIPDRKVSIYVKGCLAALLLDLEIRKETGNQKSLDDLLRVLWNDFGKKKTGYSTQDIILSAEKIVGTSLSDFFRECIFGRTDLKSRLTNMLKTAGCLLVEKSSEKLSEKNLGFRTLSRESRIFVEAIAPGSPAEWALSKDDEILEINGQPISRHLNLLHNGTGSVVLQLNRWGKRVDVTLEPDQTGNYFPLYSIIQNPAATEEELQAFHEWLKH